MSDFLGRLAARARGEAHLALPRPRSRYEPGPGLSTMPPIAENSATSPPSRTWAEGGEPAPLEIPAARSPDADRTPRPSTASTPTRATTPSTPRTGPTAPTGPVAIAGEPEPASGPIPTRRPRSRLDGALSLPAEPDPETVESRKGRPEVSARRERRERLERWERLERETPGAPEPGSPEREKEREGGREGLPGASPPAFPSASPLPSGKAPRFAEPVREVPFPADWRHGRTLVSPRESPAEAGRENGDRPEPRNAPVGVSVRVPDLLPPAREPAEPVVQVHIDRIEVRATPPAGSARAAAADRRAAPAFAPRLGLAEYLKARGERRR